MMGGRSELELCRDLNIGSTEMHAGQGNSRKPVEVAVQRDLMAKLTDALLCLVKLTFIG